MEATDHTVQKVFCDVHFGKHPWMDYGFRMVHGCMLLSWLPHFEVRALKWSLKICRDKANTQRALR